MILDETRTSVVFKALCDKNRVRILKCLMDGEKCTCELMNDFKITQPALSHHMKILTDSGLVARRKEGTRTHYSISQKGIDTAIDCLNIFKEN